MNVLLFFVWENGGEKVLYVIGWNEVGYLSLIAIKLVIS